MITSVRINAYWGASLLLCLSAQAGAHVGDRVYPIQYLSDEMLQEIRLDGGLVDEWSDFRVWLAWHDDPARIYLAFVNSDDAYKNTHPGMVFSGLRCERGHSPTETLASAVSA